jgi:hypothetical protein
VRVAAEGEGKRDAETSGEEKKVGGAGGPNCMWGDWAGVWNQKRGKNRVATIQMNSGEGEGRRELGRKGGRSLAIVQWGSTAMWGTKIGRGGGVGQSAPGMEYEGPSSVHRVEENTQHSGRVTYNTYQRCGVQCRRACRMVDADSNIAPMRDAHMSGGQGNGTGLVIARSQRPAGPRDWRRRLMAAVSCAVSHSAKAA